MAKKRNNSVSLGATTFLDYKTDNVETGVKSLTSGLGAHAVICTGNSESAYLQSIRLLRALGVLVCVGIPNDPFRLPATPFDMIGKGRRYLHGNTYLSRELLTRTRPYHCWELGRDI